MKKIVLLVSAIWLALSGFGQKTMDMGLWGGTSNYFGDLEGVTHFQTFNPVGGLFARYNFNSRISLRVTGLVGKVSANGSLFGQSGSFSKGVQDVSLQGEVNYFKYIFGERKTPFSSYISGGLGFMHFRNDSLNPVSRNIESLNTITPTLAFGFGLKINVGKKLALGVEYQMRKLFDDSLDNIVDPFRNKSNNNTVQEYNDTWHNNDWATYLGLHLTYVMNMERKPCPVYDRN